MKKIVHAHEDTNMTPGFLISFIYTFILLLFKGQFLFQPYPNWLFFLLFVLFVLSTTGFFLVYLTVLLKGYGFANKPGFWLYFKIGQRYSTSGKANYFYLSKDANWFGRLSLLIIVILNLILALVCSGVVIAFDPSKFL